jgi:hypothetical protein
MKPKTIKTSYWIVTLLFSLLLLMAGITEAVQHESGKDIMLHLGYPMHVLTVIGIGKMLAAIALVQQTSRTVKEWAYAGIAFNLIGACVARADSGDSVGLIVSPLLFLAVMFLTYFLW